MAGEIVVTVPAPGVVVLVGAAGSGKSTFAARHFEPGEVLSSDAYRELVSGDAADQSATRAAFGILHRALLTRLRAGGVAVVDATNVQAHARRAIVRRAASAGVSAIAVVLDLPPLTVLAQNATRPGRIVPEWVVEQQLDDLRRSLRDGRLESEGFVAVFRLRDAAEVGAVRVVREPAAGGGSSA